MTPIDPPIFTTPRARLKRDLSVAATTTAMLFSWAFAANNLSAAMDEPERNDARMERVMLAACKLPEVNGAATVYARADGKIYCWRMR